MSSRGTRTKLQVTYLPGSSSRNSSSSTILSDRSGRSVISIPEYTDSLLNILRTSFTTSIGCAGDRLKGSIPPSNFDIVRISSTILRWCIVHCTIHSAAFSISCSSESGRQTSESLTFTPRNAALATELISSEHWSETERGLRISWLVTSMNDSCWRFASTASSVLLLSVSAANFCSVISVKQATTKGDQGLAFVFWRPRGSYTWNIFQERTAGKLEHSELPEYLLDSKSPPSLNSE